MKLGESIEQCIIREVKKETGLDVEVMKCIGIYTDPHHLIQYSDGEVRQQFSILFEYRIIGGEIAISSESTQVKFFSKKTLLYWIYILHKESAFMTFTLTRNVHLLDRGVTYA